MPVRALRPELQKIAIEELNEDPARLEADLKHIKDWIVKQPHLRARTDDQWLVAFLRGCKYSLERTKEKLDIFYTCRGTAPELNKIKPNTALFDEILSLGAFLIPPGSLGPGGPTITIIRAGMFDPNKYHIADIISMSGLLQKIMLVENDKAVVVGSRNILDLEGVTMGHFLQLTPSLMKKMVVTSQDATPFRLKGTHYLNTPPGFETVFNAINALLNEKNASRSYVHKNCEDMYETIPRDVLPAEYGGRSGTIPEVIDYWKKKVKEYSSWLEEDEKYGTDENKRPGKPKTAEDMFGVEGSFRQLQVD